MIENKIEVNMILAGDIGGTKTLLGLFDAAPVRPRAITVQSFSTLDYDDLPSMIAAFLDAAGTARGAIDRASFGVAGPVIDEAATLTNVPWRVEARTVASAFTIGRVFLLNDLEAMAWSVPVLREAEVHVLQEGVALRGGNIALIAAGTGLGQAMLHWVDGRFVPSPSEGGHADFAARTDRDVTLLRDLTARYGRAEVEHVVSGRGLINVYQVAHQRQRCAMAIDLDAPDAPAAITRGALEGTCPCCVETLDMFVEAYGAEAGNVALRAVATGGVFIGGGIAPKILTALTSGAFMRAFVAKPPLDEMLKTMPVKIILNPDAALLGAAVFAAGR
ncbi:MAG TPA: glucokinase [Vicinamibacterales bacterium]|nr:glucokinase [Vicinamibacterales bacterium]